MRVRGLTTCRSVQAQDEPQAKTAHAFYATFCVCLLRAGCVLAACSSYALICASRQKLWRSLPPRVRLNLFRCACSFKHHALSRHKQLLSLPQFRLPSSALPSRCRHAPSPPPSLQSLHLGCVCVIEQLQRDFFNQSLAHTRSIRELGAHAADRAYAVQR